MTSRPVLIAMSVLAGAQVLVGGAALGEVVGLKVAGIAIVAVAAAQAGIQFYVQGQVTPNVNVAANRDDAGRVRLGAAATDVLAGNANVGDPAKVEPKPNGIPEV